jgi:hypothetical protein
MSNFKFQQKMKKMFLSLLAVAIGTLSGHAQQANIFASGLRLEHVDGNQYTFHYTLNADAQSGSLNLVSETDAEFNIPTSAPALLTKGSHEVTLDFSMGVVLASGTYTWSITATAAPNEGTEPVKVSDNDVKFRFYFPSGLAVDNSFESPYFGRIYVAEGEGSALEGAAATNYWGEGRITHDGIYAFTPTLDAVNTEAYSGNVAWKTSASPGALSFSGDGTSPGRLSIDAAGKVYIADNSISNSGIYVLDPANPTANFIPVFSGVLDATGLADNHGRIPALCVEDSGENTVLYTIDRNFLNGTTAKTYLPSGMIFKYETGSALPFAAQPLTIYDNANNYLANDAMSLVSDGRGGFWATQNRGTDAAGIPSLMHVDHEGSVDYRSADGSNVNLGNSARGALALNKDKTLLAVSSARGAKVFSVTYNSETGIPALTQTCFVNVNVSNIDGLAFDVADNLYITTASTEYLLAYALPKANNTFTTPAPASSTVTIDAGTPSIAGDYYIPNDPGEGKKWFASLAEAFTAINEQTISGNVNLYINGDITSTVNVGLVNGTEHSITIRPVFGQDEEADAIRTITFNQTTDNAGPSGAICLGIGMGIAWAEIAPAKNITIDGSVGDAPNRRLKIATAATQQGLNGPILILDKCSDIVIKNCILEHVGAASTGSNYAVYLRVNTTPAYGSKEMPVNVTILNNEIINTTAGASSQGIAIYANAEPVAPSTGVVIKDNSIRARTRGIFLNEVNGIEITGNEFHINQSSGGLSSAAIFGNSRINGDIQVTGNHFVELKSANANTGDWGVKAIITGGAASTWYIDNNYFTGFDKTSATSGTTMLQGIRLGALAGSYIRHNTFYLNPVTEANRPTNPSTPAAADGAYAAINIAAGTPVIQNNLFVSGEDAFPNFFIRGDVAFTAADNNIFCLPASAVNAKIASGTAPSDLTSVAEVVFEDAAAGILDLAGTSNKDRHLGVAPLAEVLSDIYGTLRSTTLTYAGAFEGDEFEPGENINSLAAGDIHIAQKGNQLTITVLSGRRIQVVKLYDLQGRTIIAQQGLATSVHSLPAPDKGVYIVETQVDGVRNVQKIIVR